MLLFGVVLFLLLLLSFLLYSVACFGVCGCGISAALVGPLLLAMMMMMMTSGDTRMWVLLLVLLLKCCSCVFCVAGVDIVVPVDTVCGRLDTMRSGEYEK